LLPSLKEYTKGHTQIFQEYAGLAMAFKLAQKAERGWRRLNGSAKLQDLIDGIVFVDGERKAA
jgi:hypothetical protein